VREAFAEEMPAGRWDKEAGKHKWQFGSGLDFVTACLRLGLHRVRFLLGNTRPGPHGVSATDILLFRLQAALRLPGIQRVSLTNGTIHKSSPFSGTGESQNKGTLSTSDSCSHHLQKPTFLPIDRGCLLEAPLILRVERKRTAIGQLKALRCLVTSVWLFLMPLSVADWRHWVA
jgi:hypothetical protein